MSHKVPDISSSRILPTGSFQQQTELLILRILLRYCPYLQSLPPCLFVSHCETDLGVAKVSFQHFLVFSGRWYFCSISSTSLCDTESNQIIAKSSLFLFASPIKSIQHTGVLYIYIPQFLGLNPFRQECRYIYSPLRMFSFSLLTLPRISSIPHSTMILS